MCGLIGVVLCCGGLCEGFLRGWAQVESRCGHVSISWFGQSVQLGLGYARGFPKVVREFLIDLLIRHPFVDIREFGFTDS